MQSTAVDTDFNKGTLQTSSCTPPQRYHQPQTDSMADQDKRQRGKAPYPGAKSCLHTEHGWCGHNTQQCKRLKKRTTEDSSEDAGARGIRCFGCGKTGHRVYNCPQYGDKIKRKRGPKPVQCFFCGEDHFVSECPKHKEPDFDINTVLDKWDEYRQANPRTQDISRAAEARRNDAKHTAGKWMLRIKSRSRDNISEAHINTLLDLIEDDEWVLEWPHDHLRECTVGGLQSEAEMQALSTRIHRKVPELHVEGCGRLPDYTEPRTPAWRTGT